MIIKYDIEKLLKNKKISKASYAEALGVSKQLAGYYIKKGEPTLSQIQILAELLEIKTEKLVKIITNEYVRIRI